MKFFICSDLHTEFLQPFEQKILFDNFPDTEGIIIAGDLSTQKYLVDNLKYLCDKYMHVIYVTGNHEYYGSSFVELYGILSYLSNLLPNLYWLNNNRPDRLIGNDMLVGGTTLWFKDDPLNQLYEKQMNDFFYIKDFRKLVYAENEHAMQALQRVTNKHIVVTHHLPSYQSVNKKYKGDQLNRFFVCDIENLIVEKQPKFFIHGHTHDSCDYMIGETRVLCNPLGYPHERNINFKYDLVIDI